MKKTLIIILPFIVYFGLGWLAKYIYFYFNAITPNTTIQEIYNGELMAVTVLCMLYNAIAECFITNFGESKYKYTVFIAHAIVLTLFIFAIPISIGATIAFSLINIGLMIAYGLKSLED